MTDEERFVAALDQSGGPDSCWEWQRSRKTKGGYGFFTPKGQKLTLAHRFAYRLWVGPIPPGMLVCHSCDNPPCCNPAHLWLGTPKQNMEDMIAKGRQRFMAPHNPATGERHWTAFAPEKLARGEAQGLSKLTADSVRALRAEYARGDVSLKQLAAKYGVHFGTISRVIRRETWAHID